jgi:hypothetical protein
VSWATRAALALPIALATVYGGGCGAATVARDAADAASDAAPALALLLYEPHLADDPSQPVAGGPTDEALLSLLAARPIDGTPKASVWITPVDAAVVDRAHPPTFAWKPTATALLPTAPLPVAPPQEPFRAPLPFGPERLAHAHLPPFSGTAYLLELSTSGGSRVVRLLTASPRFTPDDATWAMLTAQGGPITVGLRNARFTDNRVDADGGPFVTPSITLTVAP